VDAGRALQVSDRDEHGVLRAGEAGALAEEVARAPQALFHQQEAIDQAPELDIAAAFEQRPPRHRQRRVIAALHTST